MNKSLLLLIICLVIVKTIHAQYDSILFEGLNRTYLLHLPPAYSENEKLPLVLVLHGGFGNAYNIENQSRFSEKADLENFMVLYPEGTVGGLLNVSSWNAGWCCGSASSSQINDVAFINALLDTIIANYATDTSRIYISGMSNGGFMSYRLACELPNRIAAIAPVAASMSVSECEISKPVPIISFHSYMDEHIPYLGGIGNGPSDHYNPPQDSVYKAWTDKNSCLQKSDTMVSSSEYTFIKSTDCDCNAELHYYITQDGGHSWPGGVKTIIGDPVSEYLNATDLIWDFFKNYSLNCDQTSINYAKSGKEDCTIYPNPASKYFEIKISNAYNELEIKVFSLLGEKLICTKGTTTVDISSLKNGVYSVFINFNDKPIKKNLIKVE